MPYWHDCCWKNKNWIKGNPLERRGKYASLYHPSAIGSSKQSLSSSNPGHGNGLGSRRPLTVGEIEVNWTDGACLSDTLLTRYKVDDGKNPLPILQEVVELLQQQQAEEQHVRPNANAVVCKALSACEANVILRVGHESDLKMILAALQGTPLQDIAVHTLVQEALFATTSVSLLVCNDNDMSPTKLLEQVLMNAPNESTLYVIDNCWNTLREAKVLFGDYIPRVGGKDSAAFGGSQQLSLNLWNDGCKPASVLLCNNAEMDPWTNLMEQHEFVALASPKQLG